MSISIGKTPRYQVSDIALTVYTNASNQLKLTSDQQRNNILFRDFKIGQDNNVPTSFQIDQSNVLLTEWNLNRLTFLQNTLYQSNVIISKDLTIQSNIASLQLSSSNLQLQSTTIPLRIYDASQALFLDLNASGNMKHMGNIGIGITNPQYALDVSNSAYIHSNIYGGQFNSSNLFVNEIRGIPNLQNSIVFGVNQLEFTASEVTIENPTLIGTITYDGTIALQQSIIATLESCNIAIVNKSLIQQGIYVKQLNPSFGLTSNHGALHIDSYFPSIERNVPIFLVDTFGRISSGRYTSNYPTIDAAFSYLLDENREVYISSFMNLSTCNAFEQTIIDKKGHIGIGTSSTQHFLQITNPYTGYESYYKPIPSLIKLYQTTSNIKPYMMFYNCNENVCFQINSNGAMFFQNHKQYDDRYQLEISSNAYVNYLHTDQLYSSTGIINFTQSYLSNIDHLNAETMYVKNGGSLSNIYASGITLDNINIGAFDYINIPSTNYEEFRIATSRLLYIGSNFVMNPNRYFFEVEQSNLTNDKIRIYANGNPTKEVNVIHTIANNRTSTFNITNCNTTLNSVAQIQFDANQNIYQFGILNTADFYGQGYITCNIDVTDTNRELTFTSEGTLVGNKIHLSKVGRVTLNDVTTGTHSLTVLGDVEVISATTGASNFIVTSQGNVGFGTNQPRTYVDINTPHTFLFGNMGVGITTPSYAMDISGTLNATRVLGVEYRDLRGGQFNQWVLADTGIYFNQLSSNVGIGTTAPNASLHIHTCNHQGPSLGCYLSDDILPIPIMEYTPSHNQLKISGGMVIGYTSTSNQVSAPKDSLIVDGSIGIGTTYPTKALQIEGDVKITQHTSNDTNVYIGTNYDVYISTKLTSSNVEVRTGNFETIQSSLLEGFSNIAYFPPTGMVRNSALTSNGDIIEWSDITVDGQELLEGALEGSSNIVIVTDGYYHGLILNMNNTVTDELITYYTQVSVPISLSNLISTAIQIHKYELTSDGRTGGGSIYFSGIFNDFTYNQTLLENCIYSTGTQKSELLVFKGKTTNGFSKYIWTSICWASELSTYVAVGWEGSIGYSSSGLDWTIVTVSGYENEYWSSVVWSPELSLFVVVGWSSYILTSSDGITWTAVTVPYNIWNSVCWSSSLSLFVAVSWGRILTSSNGTTWNEISAPIDNIWQSICWSPELYLFVAVAYAGSTNRVMTSSNGTVWTLQTTPNNSWQSVCWAPELTLFVAVASSGTNDRVMTSSNGTSWTSRTSAIDNDWFSVSWSPELSLFVAVAYSYTGTNNQLMTSTNGTTWNIGTLLNDSKWRSIIWSSDNQTFIAVGGEGINRLITSFDGIIWTKQSGIKQSIRLKSGQINLDVYSSSTIDRTTENTCGYFTTSGLNGLSNLTTPILQTNSISDTNGIYLLQRNIYDTPGVFTITPPNNLKYTYARIQMWGAGGGGGGADFQGVVNNGVGSVVPGGGAGGGGAYGEIIMPYQILQNSTLTGNVGYGGTGGLGGYIATTTAINANKISSTVGVGQAGTDGTNGTATTISLSMITGNSTLAANWYANGGTGGRVGVGTVAGVAGTGGTLLGTFSTSQSGTAGGAGGSTASAAAGTNLTASGFAASGGGGGGGLPATLPAPKINHSGGNSGTGCIPFAYLVGTAIKAEGERANGTGTIISPSENGYTIYDTYGGGTGGGGSSSLASTIAGGLAIVNPAKRGGWPGGGGGGGGSAKQVFPNTGYSGYGASVTAGYGGNGGNGAIIITYY